MNRTNRDYKYNTLFRDGRRWRRRSSAVKTWRKIARGSTVLTTKCARRPRPWTAARERSFVRAASSMLAPGRRQPRPRYHSCYRRARHTAPGRDRVPRREHYWKSNARSPPPWRPSDTNSFSSATPRERGSSWGETCK